MSNEIRIDSNTVHQIQRLDKAFELEMYVRLMGNSPEISSKGWRFVAKTIQNDQIVWISKEITISYGSVALRTLLSPHDVCFIGARCSFEFQAINPFDLPVPGVALTIIDNNNYIQNSSFSSRFHSGVSNSRGLLTVSVEFQNVVSGKFAVIGFIVHDAGGSRYLTTKNVTVVNIITLVKNPGKLDFSRDLSSTTIAPSFHFRSNRTGELTMPTYHLSIILLFLFRANVSRLWYKSIYDYKRIGKR
jgi:hypothetical protein